MIPHEPWLVALSIAIAIQGSFVGLSLARGIDCAEGFRRRLAIAGSAITLATGVWSMHFVAMLAANFPSAVDYLVLPTLISFLICVIVVGIGVYAAHAPGPPALRIGTGALGDGPRRQPHALCRHVGGASGRADVVRRPPMSSPRSPCRSRPAPLRSGRSTAAPTRAAVVPRRDSRSAWRSPACTIRRWPGCGLTRSATTFRVSSAPNSALSRNTLALLATSSRSACPAPSCSRSCRMRARPERRGAAEPDRRCPPHARVQRADAVQGRRSAEPPPVDRPSGEPRVDPGREGRPPRDIAVERHLRRPRQRALHLCPRRREGIFLHALDQRARGAARPRGFLRVHRSHIVSVDASRGSSARRSRHRRTRVAGAVQHPDRARALPPGQAAIGASRAETSAAIHEMRHSADAFRAHGRRCRRLFGASVHRAVDCAAAH